MKAKIQGVEVEGTPEEISHLIFLNQENPNVLIGDITLRDKDGKERVFIGKAPRGYMVPKIPRKKPNSTPIITHVGRARAVLGCGCRACAKLFE